MNTRIRELFNLEGNFFFKNVISNTTNEEKVISEISPEIYEAVEKLAFAKDLFYPQKV